MVRFAWFNALFLVSACACRNVPYSSSFKIWPVLNNIDEGQTHFALQVGLRLLEHLHCVIACCCAGCP